MKQLQTEAYTTSLSLEIKTPIDTSLYFLKLVMQLICTSNELPPILAKKLSQYSIFMTNQLTLSAGYIDDLLEAK